MRAAQIIMRCFAWMIIAMLTLPPGMPAQEAGQPEQTDKFTKEELAQLLAPIALYPDTVIAQMLMASTYPLEVVDAERWLRQNKGLKGDALDNALKEKTWDPSVKSLCHYPDVLFAMSEKLDLTRKLGDAFLSQEDDVMATIQELRKKAEEQGNLKTTEEQRVIVEEDVIRIEPADPQVVYVPLYNPYYVYGPWWYPAYPPYYWYYQPGVVITGGYISFGFGFFVGLGISSWSWFDWHHHHVYVDHHKAGRFHRFDSHKRDIDRSLWRHDPGHRKGVAYRDTSTSVRFGAEWPKRPSLSPETRGYPATSVERRSVGPSPRTIERREGPRATAPAPTERIQRDAGRMSGVEPSRPTVQRREGIGATAPAPTGRIQRDAGRYNTFRGIGSGNFERRASERGAISRQSPGAVRQGGGVRGGGGSPSRGGSGGSRGGGGSSGGGGMGGSRR